MKLKKLRSTLGALLVCFSVAPSVSALMIDPILSDSNITVGETFEIEIWARDASVLGDEVLAFGFDTYNSDSSVLSMLSFSVGPLFNDDSALFANTEVAGSAFPGLVDNDILLATISYAALSVGGATVGILSDLMDLNEGLIYFMQASQDITTLLDITVSPVGVPEPSSVFLWVLGLAGIFYVNRRISGVR